MVGGSSHTCDWLLNFRLLKQGAKNLNTLLAQLHVTDRRFVSVSKELNKVRGQFDANRHAADVLRAQLTIDASNANAELVRVNNCHADEVRKLEQKVQQQQLRAEDAIRAARSAQQAVQDAEAKVLQISTWRVDEHKRAQIELEAACRDAARCRTEADGQHQQHNKALADARREANAQLKLIVESQRHQQEQLKERIRTCWHERSKPESDFRQQEDLANARKRQSAADVAAAEHRIEEARAGQLTATTQLNTQQQRFEQRI